MEQSLFLYMYVWSIGYTRQCEDFQIKADAERTKLYDFYSLIVYGYTELHS